jgi:hypothetical protein
MLADSQVEYRRSSVEDAVTAQLSSADEVIPPAEGLVFPPNFIANHLSVFLDILAYCHTPENNVIEVGTQQPPSQLSQIASSQLLGSIKPLDSIWQSLCQRLFTDGMLQRFAS